MLNRLSRAQLMLVSAIGGIVGLGIIAAAIGVMVIAFGWYDVSASKPHGKLTSWVLHTTMINSVRARAKYETAPRLFSSEQVKEGFGEYEEHCVMCHGGPGVARAKWVMGLEPTPPYLVDAARRWSPAELRFIISHGVKMTAMPAWGLSQPRDDITSLVAFLKKLPDVSPSEYSKLRAERRAHPSEEDGSPEGTMPR